MLAHPTLEKLHALRLTGMARAFEEQLHMDDIDVLSTEERLGLMADREMTERDARRLKYRLRKAKLRHPEACIEDIDYRHSRRLDRSLSSLTASASAPSTTTAPINTPGNLARTGKRRRTASHDRSLLHNSSSGQRM